MVNIYNKKHRLRETERQREISQSGVSRGLQELLRQRRVATRHPRDALTSQTLDVARRTQRLRDSTAKIDPAPALYPTSGCSHLWRGVRVGWSPDFLWTIQSGGGEVGHKIKSPGPNSIFLGR